MITIFDGTPVNLAASKTCGFRPRASGSPTSSCTTGEHFPLPDNDDDNNNGKRGRHRDSARSSSLIRSLCWCRCKEAAATAAAAARQPACQFRIDPSSSSRRPCCCCCCVSHRRFLSVSDDIGTIPETISLDDNDVAIAS